MAKMANGSQWVDSDGEKINERKSRMSASLSKSCTQARAPVEHGEVGLISGKLQEKKRDS